MGSSMVHKRWEQSTLFFENYNLTWRKHKQLVLSGPTPESAVGW